MAQFGGLRAFLSPEDEELAKSAILANGANPVRQAPPVESLSEPYIPIHPQTSPNIPTTATPGFFDTAKVALRALPQAWGQAAQSVTTPVVDLMAKAQDYRKDYSPEFNEAMDLGLGMASMSPISKGLGALGKVAGAEAKAIPAEAQAMKAGLTQAAERLETRPIKFTEPVTVKDVAGVPKTITPEPNMFISKVGKNYEIHDGQTVKVRPNVAQDFQNRFKVPVIPEGDFAPELGQVDEVKMGGVGDIQSFEQLPKPLQNMVDTFDSGKMTQEEFVQEVDKFGYDVKFNMDGELDSFAKQGTNPTKFHKYTEPGGENYREILLRKKNTGLKYNPSLSFDDYAMQDYGKKWDKLTESEKNKLAEAVKIQFIENKGGSFKSSHWEEPNVVSHLRMNDRVTPDGKKVAFMEELQSDWALAGRKEGFKKTLTESEKEELTALEKAYKNPLVEFNTTHQARFDELTGRQGKAVPNHPLLKNWQETTLKRALKEAVDSDAEYLAWTSGEQQAARYDLSKHISEVHYSGTNLKAYDLNGKEVINQTGIQPNELENYIGKDAAKKLLEQKPKGTLRSLENADLKVGGEWANNLYDKQVPNILKKLTGQKAEMIELPSYFQTGTSTPMKMGGGAKGTQQQAIRITPEIRAMVKGKPGKFSELRKTVKGE